MPCPPLFFSQRQRDNFAKTKSARRHVGARENVSVNQNQAAMSPRRPRTIRVKAEKDPAASLRRIRAGTPPNDFTASEGLLRHDTQFPSNGRADSCPGWRRRCGCRAIQRTTGLRTHILFSYLSCNTFFFFPQHSNLLHKKSGSLLSVVFRK